MTGPTLETHSVLSQNQNLYLLITKAIDKQHFFNEKNEHRDPKLQYAYREGLLAHSESDLQFIIMLFQFAMNNCSDWERF